MATKVVFFDAGNTLLCAHPSLGGVYRQVCLRHGFDIDAEVVEGALRAIWSGSDSAFGPTPWQDVQTSDAHDREMWVAITTLLHRRLGWPEVPFGPWFADLWRTFGSAAAWRPYDDVAPVLDELSARGIRVGIISNWDSRLFGIVEEIGLATRMTCVLASAQVGVRKPDPEIYRRALAATGAEAREAAMVGDTLRDDVEGACAAGLTGVLLDRGGRHAGPASYPVIRSLMELPAVLGM